MVDFLIRVKVDPSGAVTGSQAVGAALGGATTKADLLRASLVRTFGFLAAGAGIRSAIGVLADFNQSMATVRAVTGATADEFRGLEESALELGKTTRFTATEAADALVLLSRAGFTVTESLKSVEATLRLAQAGGLGLEQAADITASTLRGFRLEANQAARVADVLAKGANSANTTVGELGEGMKFVAPVAAGLGISLEEASAAMLALSDAGLKGSLAGTGLRRVLSELESPSKKTTDVLATMGLTAADVRVSQVGLTAALQKLREAGVDTGAALELFGDRGGPAFEVLSNAIPKVERLNKTLQNAKGAAAATAKVMDDSLQGAFKRVASAAEAVVLQLGRVGGTGQLRAVFESLATGLRTVAENADKILVAVEVLSAGLLLRLIPRLIQSQLLLTSLSKVGPFIAVTAAVVAANVVFAEMEGHLKAIADATEKLEADAVFGSIGAQIRLAQKELIALQQRAVISPAAAERIQDLTDRIKSYQGEAKGAADRAKQLKDAQAAQATTVDGLLTRLDRQAKLLALNNRETEIQTQLQSELDRLLHAGVVASPAQRQEVEDRLRAIQSIKDEQSAFESIRGPQEQHARDVAALSALLQAGRITQDEYAAALARVNDELGKTGAGASVFQEQVRSLQEQNDLLRVRITFGEQAAQRLAIEQQLAREGVALTGQQKTQLDKLIAANEDLKALEERRQAAAAVDPARQQAQVDALARELDVSRQLAEQYALLNLVEKQREDLAPQVQKAIEDLHLRELEAATDLEAGFERAFLKIKREAEDLASVSERVVGVFADNATDALVKFAETGKFAFQDFARGILSDVTRIIARLLVLQAIQAAVGIFSGSPVPGGAPGLASGGPVQPNRAFLVGERGPELFVPRSAGSVVPARETATAMSSPVIRITNVSDPSEIPAAIGDGRADQEILNVLQRNAGRVRQVLGS